MLIFTYTGAKVFEGVAVESIQTKNNAVSSVTTDKGNINCEIFVNCAGLVGMRYYMLLIMNGMSQVS